MDELELEVDWGSLTGELTPRADWPGMIWRRLDDRRWVGVMPLLFTYGVCWGWIGDPTGVEDRWCYPKASGLELAVAAATLWAGSGDPIDGWVRQVSTGRRRPDGTPESEYIEP